MRAASTLSGFALLAAFAIPAAAQQFNLLKVDLSPANVVTIYLLTSSNTRLRPNLERYLRPGARVVSNDFEIRGWRAKETVNLRVEGMEHTIYLYQIGKK